MVDYDNRSGYIINNPPLCYYNGYIPPNRYGYKPPNRLYNGYIPPSSYGSYGIIIHRKIPSFLQLLRRTQKEGHAVPESPPTSCAAAARRAAKISRSVNLGAFRFGNAAERNKVETEQEGCPNRKDHFYRQKRSFFAKQLKNQRYHFVLTPLILVSWL